MKRCLLLVLISINILANVHAQNNNSLVINEIMTSNVDCFLSPSINFDGWVELYNPSNYEISLGNCYISDDGNNLRKWRCPASMPTVSAKGYVVVWFDSNEINPCEPDFKLDIDGGTIYISDTSGNLIVSQDYPATIRRTSYARINDGEIWGITANPTPGYKNDCNGFYDSQLEDPIVSQLSQLFEGTLDVNVEFPKGTTLIYTLDGSTPIENNGYVSEDGHFSFTETANIRFRLFQEGKIPSNVVTRSYIKKEHNFTIPVISVVSDEKYLYDDSIGIMVEGVNGILGGGMVANWNNDWERPAHFSYIEDSDKNLCDIEQDVIINVAGGWSRRFDIKSIKIKGSKVFGKKTIDYPFFKDKPFIHNRTLLLRNGGNDYRFRIMDAALETLILRSGVDVDLQCYQPVMYYLNGKLVGVVNLREPNNKHYVYANYGLDDDEIDMFGPEGSLLCGDYDAFNRWYELSKGVSDNHVYKDIMNIVDIDEYSTYLASNIYLNLHDGWPRGNFKYFRPKDGRFRFISYDLDLPFWRSESVFRLMFDKSYYRDSIMYKDTELFLNMLNNDSFRRRFVDKICIMGGAVFNSSHTNDVLDYLAKRVENMMEITNETPWPRIDQIKEELQMQNDIIIEDMMNFEPIRLKDTPKIHAKIFSDLEDCKLYVNETIIPYSDFDGTIFLPAIVKAVAPSGYRFLGWKSGNGAGYVTKNAVAEVPQNDFSWQACFEPMEENEKKKAGIYPVMINEISPANDSYINDYYRKEDWVELYNTTSKPIDIEGMYLSDDNSNLHKYQINGDGVSNTIIKPGGHLIIWCDKKEPKSMVHAPFKLDADGGTLFLTSKDGVYTDSLSYSAMDSKVTVGRFPDGATDIFRMNISTIGKSNIFTSYSIKEIVATSIRMKPNINNGIELNYEGGKLVVKSYIQNVRMEIYNILGVKVWENVLNMNGIEEIDVAFLPKGCYIAKTVRNTVCKFVVN